MTDPKVIPGVAPASVNQDMDSLLFDALAGEDHHRLSLLLSFMMTDPERTAKLAQFEQELRHAEPRS